MARGKPCAHDAKRQCLDCQKKYRREYMAARRVDPLFVQHKIEYKRDWYAKPENKEKVARRARRPDVREKKNTARRMSPAHRAKAAEGHARNNGYPWAPGQVERAAALLSADSIACAVCGTEETERRFHIDHDHETGVIRSILCPKHNKTLGMADDDAAMLRALADYLDSHNSRGSRFDYVWDSHV